MAEKTPATAPMSASSSVVSWYSSSSLSVLRAWSASTARLAMPLALKSTEFSMMELESAGTAPFQSDTTPSSAAMRRKPWKTPL